MCCEWEMCDSSGCRWGPPKDGYMQCSVSWKGAKLSHIGLGARRRLHLGASGCTHNMAHERTARHMLYQRISAQRLLYITQYRYACTHMCRGACVHPSFSGFLSVFLFLHYTHTHAHAVTRSLSSTHSQTHARTKSLCPFFLHTHTHFFIFLSLSLSLCLSLSLTQIH